MVERGKRGSIHSVSVLGSNDRRYTRLRAAISTGAMACCQCYGSESKMIRFPRRETCPRPGFADKFSVAHRHFSANSDYARTPFDLPCLRRRCNPDSSCASAPKCSAIVRDRRPRGPHPPRVGWCLCAGKRPKIFAAWVLAGGDELVQIDAARFHAVGVVEIDAIFQRRDAVGDLGEIVLAHLFSGPRNQTARGLWPALSKSVPQCVPEHVLVLLVAQGRRHDKLGAFEFGFSASVLSQADIESASPPRPCTPRCRATHCLPQGLLATQMHDVNMRTGHLGERHQVMHAFGFDHRRPAPVMIFRTSFAFGQKLLLQFRDQLRIFAMRGDDDAEFLGQLQRFDKARRR